MSRDTIKRILALESHSHGRPELKSMVMQPGESWSELKARARAWQAERPRTRTLSVRLVGIQEDS